MNRLKIKTCENVRKAQNRDNAENHHCEMKRMNERNE